MAKKKIKKMIKIGFIIFILIALITTGFLVLSSKFKVIKFDDKISINYKDTFKYDDNVCYGNLIKCKKVKATIDGSVNTDTLDTYKLKYTYKVKNKEYVLNQTVEVKDLDKPVISFNGDEFIACPNGKLIKGEIVVTDNFDTDLNDSIKKEINDNKLIVSATDSSGNKTTEKKEIVIKDDTAPTIKLNGSKNTTIFLGTKYEEKGATVEDNCDDNLQATSEGSVDDSKAGTYKITYKATDSSNNTSTAERIVTVREKQAGERVVYLTFDDGPSSYTSSLLDVLKKYNAKATFFVTKNGDDSIIKREYDEGHTVALHTYSHSYDKIYASQEAYFADLYKIQERVKRITGETSMLIRFPGGSSNTVSKTSMRALTKEVQNRGFKYFDWNVSSGDAGGTTSSDGVYNNVIKSLKSGSSVVLQHDTKKFSVDAVERILQYGRENGYTFERLTASSPGMHHGTNN